MNSSFSFSFSFFSFPISFSGAERYPVPSDYSLQLANDFRIILSGELVAVLQQIFDAICGQRCGRMFIRRNLFETPPRAHSFAESLCWNCASHNLPHPPSCYLSLTPFPNYPTSHTKKKKKICVVEIEDRNENESVM